VNVSISLLDVQSFWISFFVSAVLSKPILSLLIKVKSRQTVSSHLEGHAAKQGTPTMGGFIILVGFLLSSLLGAAGIFGGPIVGLVSLFALIGFVDDYLVPRLMPGKRGLGWKQKILMQVFAAALPLVWAGLSPLSIGLGVFLILFFANAYNFADGLDGLAGTILLGQLLGLVTLGSVYEQLQFPTWVVWPLLGSLLVFLCWNAPKARVFMGDVGSLPIGALLGAFWVLHMGVSSEKSGQAASAETVLPFMFLPILIWSIPMVCELVPVPLQVFSVKVFKRKLFPFTPIHHAFEEIKLNTGETEESESYKQRVKTSPRWAHWPETRIVFTFAILQLLCSLLAITVAMVTKIYR
jgi:phospho-N-acetylmuramoyl-pentapeptide-transferase